MCTRQGCGDEKCVCCVHTINRTHGSTYLIRSIICIIVPKVSPNRPFGLRELMQKNTINTRRRWNPEFAPAPKQQQQQQQQLEPIDVLAVKSQRRVVAATPSEGKKKVHVLEWIDLVVRLEMPAMMVIVTSGKG